MSEVVFVIIYVLFNWKINRIKKLLLSKLETNEMIAILGLSLQSKLLSI